MTKSSPARAARQQSTEDAPIPIRAKATPEELQQAGTNLHMEPGTVLQGDVSQPLTRQQVFQAAVAENLKAELGLAHGTIVELKTQIMMMGTEAEERERFVQELSAQVDALTQAFEAK